MSIHTPKRRQRLIPEQQAEHNERLISEFHQRCPVGSRIWFWKTLPFGPVIETILRDEAFIADSGQPVCFLQGVSGYVSIFHVQPINESRRKDLSFDWICPDLRLAAPGPQPLTPDP